MKLKFFVLTFIFTAGVCFAQNVEQQEQVSPADNTTQTTLPVQEDLSNEDNSSKKIVENPMTFTMLFNGYFSLNNPNDKTGFGSGFRYKYSFLKYFALATSLEYTSIGFLESQYVDLKALFMVQRNLPLHKNGFVPYAGIGPVFRTDVSGGTSAMGYTLTAGTQYVWKSLVTGFGIDYSSIPQFKDTTKNIYNSDVKAFFEIGARF